MTIYIHTHIYIYIFIFPPYICTFPSELCVSEPNLWCASEPLPWSRPSKTTRHALAQTPFNLDPPFGEKAAFYVQTHSHDKSNLLVPQQLSHLPPLSSPLPSGFVLLFCAAVSILCDAFADVIGLFGACFGTLICLIWPLRTGWGFMWCLRLTGPVPCADRVTRSSGSAARVEDSGERRNGVWLFLGSKPVIGRNNRVLCMRCRLSQDIFESHENLALQSPFHCGFYGTFLGCIFGDGSFRGTEARLRRRRRQAGGIDRG